MLHTKIKAREYIIFSENDKDLIRIDVTDIQRNRAELSIDAPQRFRIRFSPRGQDEKS